MNDDLLLQSAAHALERGNSMRAREHLAAIDRPSAESWQLKAVALGMEGDEQGAIEAIKRGLSMDPQNLHLRLLWGDQLANANPAEAEAVYLGILTDYPTEPTALLPYAWLLATQGDSEGARGVMERVPGHLRASDPQALGIDGLIALSEGRIREARTTLDRGLETDPNSVFLHTLHTMVGAADPGSSRKMIDHMNAAASADPRHAGALGYEARYLSHPLMAPVHFVDRIGTGKLYLTWLAFFFGVRRLWPDGPWGWILLVYLSLALYTWIAPSILRKFLERKGEL